MVGPRDQGEGERELARERQKPRVDRDQRKKEMDRDQRETETQRNR